MLNKAEHYKFDEPNLFDQKLIEEGYVFEGYVKQLIASWQDAASFDYQAVFETDHLYARLDLAKHRDDGSIDIYEIKSSTSVKKEQLQDAAFQALVAEQGGVSVGKIFVVHLNKDYVRDGDVEPHKLVAISDETIRVRSTMREISDKVSEAVELLAREEIDESSCSCLTVGRARHCNSFEYFNPNIPTPSIYNLPRISGSKLAKFLADGRFSLDDIDLSEVTGQQKFVLEAHQNGGQYIDSADITNFFSTLKYPLYFLDYEAYGSAIPPTDGLKPHAHLPFQFSLHVLSEDGVLTHHEYLAEQMGLPIKLIEALERFIGPTGSVITWHKTYENSRNQDMAAIYPSKSDFLNDIIDRTVDLEDVFKTGYVDIAFGGSTSIKKVLPVIAPDLTYEGLDIAGGTEAMAGWAEFIVEENSAKKNKLRDDLLAYCKLDTLAMVKVFQFVEELL
ncbi:DUF2779 domain-containing protein [Cognatishimia activa]|nr:DUF2779 domain-containing protein [Cognatishimia activa]